MRYRDLFKDKKTNGVMIHHLNEEAVESLKDYFKDINYLSESLVREKMLEPFGCKHFVIFVNKILPNLKDFDALILRTDQVEVDEVNISSYKDSPIMFIYLPQNVLLSLRPSSRIHNIDIKSNTI